MGRQRLSLSWRREEERLGKCLHDLSFSACVGSCHAQNQLGSNLFLEQLSFTFIAFFSAVMMRVCHIADDVLASLFVVRELKENKQGEIDEMVELYVERGMGEADAAECVNLMSKYPEFFINVMMVSFMNPLRFGF